MRRRFWLGIAGGATVVVSAIALGAVVSPVTAAVTRIFSSSESSSRHMGEAVGCPTNSGLAVFGGGVYLTGAKGHAYVTEIETLNGAYLTRADEDGTGADANWTLTAQAICAPVTFDTEGVFARSTQQGTNASWVSTTCPAGMVVIGVGGQTSLQTINGEVRYIAALTAARPSTTSLLAVAVRDPLVSGGVVTTSVTGICGIRPSGYQIVKQVGPMASPSSSTVTATCPAGKHLYGSGFALIGEVPNLPVAPIGVFLDDLKVSNTSVTVTGVEYEGGVSANWRPEAYAVCASASA